MNEKLLIKIIVVMAVVGGIFGFVLPPLMSAKSDGAVIAGVIILFALGVAGVVFVNRVINNFSEKKDEPKK